MKWEKLLAIKCSVIEISFFTPLIHKIHIWLAVVSDIAFNDMCENVIDRIKDSFTIMQFWMSQTSQ